MHGVIAALRRTMPGLEIVVTGGTLNDDELFRVGNAFVTGPMDADELAIAFRRLRLDRVLCCLARPLFGHPVPSAAMMAGLPVAYLDWSCGHCAVRASDLPLDPQLSMTDVVERLVPWLQGAQPA